MCRSSSPSPHHLITHLSKKKIPPPSPRPGPLGFRLSVVINPNAKEGKDLRRLETRGSALLGHWCWVSVRSGRSRSLHCRPGSRSAQGVVGLWMQVARGFSLVGGGDKIDRWMARPGLPSIVLVIYTTPSLPGCLFILSRWCSCCAVAANCNAMRHGTGSSSLVCWKRHRTNALSLPRVKLPRWFF